jgi:phenylacetate-CoA ligase
MLAWKSKHLIGFPAYLRHIGHVMRDELNIDPRGVGIKSLIVHLGTDDRKPLEDLWNADVFDTYGTNECGSLAAECQEKNGMHIFEDAFFLEMIDPETGRDVADGERGSIYQTTLFKHLAPLIRFNSNDVSAFKSGDCACGCNHRRLDRIFGRSDNMVKLRGTNIFPEAIGALVSETRESNGEYVCVVDPGAGGQDEMTVRIEVIDEGSARAVEKALAERLKLSLGVKMLVVASQPGSLSSLTGLRDNSKVRRLIDNRPKV